jgi:voltage-gated potassium channel
VVRTLLRAGLNAAALLVVYSTVPLDRRTSGAVIWFAWGLVGFVLVVVWQIRAILRSPHPTARAVVALAATVPLFLVLFATAYLVMSRHQQASFTEPLTRTDALYLTVTIFATVGFGDITPQTETARVLVTVQMIADLLVFGLLLRVIVDVVRVARSQQASRIDP